MHTPTENLPLAADVGFLLKPEARVGRFVVRALLAQGASSEVYRAVEAGKEDAEVALKIQRADRQAEPSVGLRMLNESLVLARINDSGVVRLLESGIHTDGRPYLVCELLDASLADVGPLSAPQAVALIASLAQTLGRLHMHEIVHRDVKPQNILLAPDGQPKLADFGLAKLPRSSDSDGPFLPLSTDSQTFLGTYGYAAPEQLASTKDVDGRADVYALGVVLFELLARRRPFVAAERGRLISLQLNQPAPLLSVFVPNLPSALVSLAARMLARDPAERPDASEVARRLCEVRFRPAYPWRSWLRSIPVWALLLLPAPPSVALTPDELLDQQYQRFESALFSSSIDDAERALQMAAQSLRERGASHPLQSARHLYKQAALAKERGLLRPAIRFFSEAQASLRPLVQEQPAQAFKALSICADGLGEMSYHLGEYDQALGHYAEAAHTLPRTLAAAVSSRQVPSFLDYQRALVLREQGAIPAALDALVDAEGHERTLLAQPGAAPADHWQLARVLSLRASLLAQTGAVADAWKTACEARLHAQTALNQRPDEKRFRLTELWVTLCLGDVAARRGQDGDIYDRQALNGLAAMVASDPDNGQWIHALVEALVQTSARSEAKLRQQRASAALQYIEQLTAHGQWQDDAHIRSYQVLARTLSAL